MLSSIRWRLIASYILLSLLTVSLVGALAITLFRTSVERKEVELLGLNARAVARQAEPLMWPTTRRNSLEDLARTASYLHGGDVRILDAARRVIADSRSRLDDNVFLWIVPPATAEPQISSMIISLPALRPLIEDASPDMITSVLDAFFAPFPADTAFVLVRRVDEPWGERLVFGSEYVEVWDPEPTLVPGASHVQTITRTLRYEAITRLVENAYREDDARDGMRTATVAIGPASNPLGYVQLSRANASSSQALLTLRWTLLVAGLAAAGLAIVLGVVVSRQLVAPLQSLATTADRLRLGDLTARAPQTGGLEVERVANQFNAMADQLQTAITELAAERDALRRFIADASHELRTPLTALKNFIELLQGPAAEDPQARLEFLQESESQVRRLEWITQNLLDLSRMDAGLIHLNKARCDMNELIRTISASFEPQFLEKDVNFAQDLGAERLMIPCDEQRMEIVLSNLLDNALKYTDSGGSVVIGTRPGDPYVEIWVENSGIGIDPSDRSHIFERFYHGPSGGSGLGLAIAQSIVRAHQGNLYLDPAYQGGNRFVIKLPHGDDAI